MANQNVHKQLKLACYVPTKTEFKLIQIRSEVKLFHDRIIEICKQIIRFSNIHICNIISYTWSIQYFSSKMHKIIINFLFVYHYYLLENNYSNNVKASNNKGVRTVDGFVLNDIFSKNIKKL